MEDLHQTSIRFVLDSEPNPTTCSKTCVVNSGFFKKRRLPFASSSKCNSTCFNKPCLESSLSYNRLRLEDTRYLTRRNSTPPVGVGWSPRELRESEPNSLLMAKLSVTRLPNFITSCSVLIKADKKWSFQSSIMPEPPATTIITRLLRKLRVFRQGRRSTLGDVSREGMLLSTVMGWVFPTETQKFTVHQGTESY